MLRRVCVVLEINQKDWDIRLKVGYVKREYDDFFLMLQLKENQKRANNNDVQRFAPLAWTQKAD